MHSSSNRVLMKLIHLLVDFLRAEQIRSMCDEAVGEKGRGGMCLNASADNGAACFGAKTMTCERV